MAIKLGRSNFEKEIGHSWWKHIKFELFGEFRIFEWIFGIGIIATILFWGTIITIAGHFISKYW